jgi:nucleoid-associated protein EbfC
MLGKGNMGGLLKQAQKMQQDLEQAQANLVNLKVTGSAGGNMVVVTANAAQEVLEIKVDPQVVDPADVEMLEDLILAAVNQALQNGRAKAEEEIRQVTGGLGAGALGGLKLPGF